MGQATPKFTPSLLPRLEACLHYVAIPTPPSEAAKRGKRIDEALRALLCGDEVPPHVGKDERLVAKRACRIIQEMTEGAGLVADEEETRLKVVDRSGGVILVGQADVICPEKKMVIDLKTGKRSDYRGQMSGYALASMQRWGGESWEAVVLYADLEELESYTISLEEAERYIFPLRQRWDHRDHEEPQPCRYCRWCARGPEGDATCSAI